MTFLSERRSHMSLFGRTIDQLHHGLNYAHLKNEAISSNIANIDTPNYKAKTVNFKSLLEIEGSRQFKAKHTDPRHIDFQGFQVHSNPHVMYNHNRNSVDIDKEMAVLANNQIYQQALVDRLNGQFRSFRNVISGGS